MARLSYRLRVTGRRTSARAKSSWSPITSVWASIRWKPARIRPTVSCSRLDRASSVSEKTSPSRSTSAALWQAIKTLSPAAALSSSALTLVSSPENRSMLSIRRWQVVSSESAARVETAIVGKRISRSKLRLDGEEPARVVEPAEVVAPLLAEVGRLEQGDPGPLREKIDGMAEAGRIGVLEAERGGQRDRVPAVERALGFDVERPDRLDLVAEELDADRVGRVGGKDVEDAAADAELAGDLDDLGPRHSAFEQPRRQVFDGRRRRRRPRCATSGPGPRAWAPAAASPGTARRPAGAGWRSRAA